MEIIRDSAKQLWIDGLRYILQKGQNLVDQNKRKSKEVLGLIMTLTKFDDVEQPIDDLSHIKNWIYPRTSEIKSIIFDPHLSQSYAYSYGERIFTYGEKEINQIDTFLIPLLKKNKDSRKGIIALWNPSKDSHVDQAITPGLTTIDVKIRNNKLYLFGIVRSNDIFIGWPANLYQLYVLGEYISEKLHVKIGEISTLSTSAHVFDENTDEIRSITH